MSNKSLGRGLGALLGEGANTDFDLDKALSEDVSLDTSVDLSNTTEVEISKIVPSPYQPRKEFDKEALDALATSIKDKGVLQPLLVRLVDNNYEIIAGERRWRAAQMVGLATIPVIVKEFSDKETLEVALVENIIRENLSAIEEAEAFQRLIEEFSHTQDALSNIVGKSRSHIANTLRLLGLPASVQKMIKEGTLSAGHARQLVGLENAEELAKKIISGGLSVRATEEMIAKLKSPKEAKEPKAKKDEDLAQIEKDLIKSLGLRLQISPSKQGGGKVVLQYASVAELDMIIDILENKPKKTIIQQTAPEPQQLLEARKPEEKFSIKIID
ncbi:MAG: ParB/RepB/Spo0J family partition protein [Alphaproteobacteria bacterium]